MVLLALHLRRRAAGEHHPGHQHGRVLQQFGFGNNGVIAENEPEEQEKAIKFNTLVADLVMYQTTLDMSLVLNQLRGEGQAVHRTDVAIMSPYQEDNVRRFGDYVYDLNAPLEDMDVNLELGEETDAA
ncbi:Tn3 family transposase [Streptosporangium roseum]|uniref:Tn3 family transposase n=1 Tax=Streptosporangium roseum TaxID=2001 RepID=UPI000689756C|nr:Tn3 family transposase [Streptosporangium roseum]